MRFAVAILTLGLLLLAPAVDLRAEDDPDGRQARPPVELPASPPGVLNAGPVRELRLLEAVEMALRSNLGLQAGRITPRLAATNYQAQRAIFDPLLSAEFGYQYNESPTTTTFLGKPVITQHTFNGSAGIQQLMPTGGTVGFLYRADFLNTDSGFVSPNPSWTNRIGLEATQPLLRGAGDIVMANIRLAHNDVVTARENQRTLREGTILGVTLAYWELVRLQEDLKARFKSEETAAELLRDANARLEAKVGTPLDVAEARAGLEARRGTRITAEGRLSSQQDLLRALVLPFTPKDAVGVRFVATDAVDEAVTRTVTREDLERYVKVAVSNRPEVKATKAQLASRNIDVTAAADGVLPQLDVVAGLGTVGLSRGFSGSMGNTLSGQRAQGTQGQIGLRFSMFIGQRAARSRLRLTQWARRQAVILYKELESRIVQEVREGIRVVITAQAVLETAKAQVLAAEKNLRGERQKLLQGKSTPFQVLLKEETVTDARLRLATAATEVRKAEAGFYRAIGMLGETLGVGR